MAAKKKMERLAGIAPHVRPYYALLSTPKGKAWLGAHPECQTARDLAYLFAAMLQRLCDPSLDESDRHIDVARVRRLHYAWDDFSGSADARLRAMVVALDRAVQVKGRGPTNLAAVTAAIDVLRWTIGPPLRVRGPILVAAIDSWAKPRRSLPPILALALALRCVGRETSTQSLQQRLSRLPRTVIPPITD